MSSPQHPSDVVGLRTQPEQLWAEFVAARERAWRSADLDDGIAAGRAFAKFVHQFVPPNEREGVSHGRE